MSHSFDGLPEDIPHEELFEQVWTTFDGEEIPVSKLERSHAWNILRLLERRGYEGSSMYNAIAWHLGEVSAVEEALFNIKNIIYRVQHPRYRRL